MSNKREAMINALATLEDVFGKHKIDVGVINQLRDALAEPEQEPVAWEGGEEWESLAWQLCSDENGEEACTEVIWEGGAIPEPWGDRWLKYEGEAKRLIALVKKHTSPREWQELSEVEVREAMIKGMKLWLANDGTKPVREFQGAEISAALRAKNGG